MNVNSTFRTRRDFLGGLAFGGLMLAGPGAFAEELVRTPLQTEGPFYPDKLPLDTDNDLLDHQRRRSRRPSARSRT